MGRHSTYTQEMADEICRDIACGDSVRVACEKQGIAYKTFYVWLSEREDSQQQYMRARDTRADAHFESSSNLMDELKMGQVSPEQARIMLDEIKWKCAKQATKKYGDSTTIRGDKENPLAVAAIKIFDDIPKDS